MLADRGQTRAMDAGQAAAAGYTLVNLSDDFAPFLFAEHALPDGQVRSSHYRRTFVGLANDRLDGDGQPLAAGSKNYLEIYGIFPSFSVLRSRFLEDAERSCLPRETGATLLEAASRKRPSPATLAVVAKRLTCEGLLTPASRHRIGRWDQPLQQAVRRFQLKHMIYEGAHLRGQTGQALARDLLDNDHRSLLRSLRERVVAATGIIEDGSGSRSALGAAANLVDSYTEEVARALGLDTPEAALAFFTRHPPTDFARLLVAVKLPARPDHYAQMSSLKLVIDRGDVYYDLPFDETGRPIAQPRRRFPTLALVTEHGGKTLTLVRWRTTIGGWRLEQASDGHEYYRYKASEVGPRVIRQIVAGPVWIAPPSTPMRSLVKWKPVNGTTQPVVNYTQLGPGHLSAYGLVAGYVVLPGKDGGPERDQGIRAHGSAEYLSMYSANGYSHGCHRLPNHLAIRLFSFLLQRRTMRALGELDGFPPGSSWWAIACSRSRSRLAATATSWILRSRWRCAPARSKGRSSSPCGTTSAGQACNIRMSRRYRRGRYPSQSRRLRTETLGGVRARGQSSWDGSAG